ncbi:3-oxoacyl-ACP synthase III family protein [Flavihumibacter solisilvae]|uniref:3-oxoacyl-ACP synthase n=1 Tax=Flavihumibacter solisilvae TaxID=1349421 RepID=A0A0C1LHM8_9BACT|nr:ketoacyl-ACP synthase III [Flavihumibacter solisilvae]KIC94868.1 3-oxoacyl-ACP synthase [Flavihumibacter solisilvae]
MFRSIITGTGSYIPPFIQTNKDFTKQVFYSKGHALTTAPEEIVSKFRQITGIEERRYTTEDLNASDIGAIAAKNALADSGVNPEEIDQIIVAHNFGDVLKNTIQTAAVPSIASLIKHTLGIRNPGCTAYDILFGCPGWIQGLIQADAFFKAGLAKKALIVGTETLSRVIDVHDRDSMIFSDGAGAVVLEFRETGPGDSGLLGSSTQTHTIEEVNYINMGKSDFPDSDPNVRYIKMNGRKVYEYAMTYVPAAMKDCLDKCGIDISAVKKIFIHQANEKMDEGIMQRLFQLYGINEPTENVMPMSIHWLGNSSVATVPTLLDLVRKEQLESHRLHAGDIILFASVGAGMNINAACYRY